MRCERAFNRNDSSRPITRPSSTGKRRAYNYPAAEIIIIILRFNEHLIMLIRPVVCYNTAGRARKKNQHNAFAARRVVYIIILFICKDPRVPARNGLNL